MGQYFQVWTGMTQNRLNISELKDSGIQPEDRQVLSRTEKQVELNTYRISTSLKFLLGLNDGFKWWITTDNSESLGLKLLILIIHNMLEKQDLKHEC